MTVRNFTVIHANWFQLATGTGIAPFRSFLWKMFFEKHDDYQVRIKLFTPPTKIHSEHGSNNLFLNYVLVQFNGLAWLFLGVPTSSSLLYPDVST